MALPEEVRRQVDKELGDFCMRESPDRVREQVRVEFEIRGNNVTLIERRVPWRLTKRGEEWSRLPVAQFRFDPDLSLWSLYWSDRNGRWHLDEAPASAVLSELIDVVDRDPTGIYWG